jgi:hypothetical protein
MLVGVYNTWFQKRVCQDFCYQKRRVCVCVFVGACAQYIPAAPLSSASSIVADIFTRMNIYTDISVNTGRGVSVKTPNGNSNLQLTILRHSPNILPTNMSK